MLNYQLQRNVILGMMVTAVLCVAAGNAVAQSAPPNVEAQRAKYMAQMANYSAALADVKKKSQEYSAQLSSARKNYELLLKKQYSIGVSNESFVDIVKQLQVQRVEMIIDLAGLEAKRDLMIQLQKAAGGDDRQEILAQLKAALKLQESQAQRIEALRKSGVATETSLAEARKKVLELKIRIAEQTQPRTVAGSAGTQLLNISLDRAEKTARLNKIETLLQEMNKARTTLNEASLSERQIRNVERSLDALAKEKEQLTQALALVKEALKKSENDSQDDN